MLLLLLFALPFTATENTTLELVSIVSMEVNYYEIITNYTYTYLFSFLDMENDHHLQHISTIPINTINGPEDGIN